MKEETPDRISRLVRAYAAGDSDAYDELVPLVYEELRSMAARLGASGTLQPTALVHETVLKLGTGREGLQDKQHFLAVASRAMRNLLSDHARNRSALKRGGNLERVTLSSYLVQERNELDLSALDEAMTALEHVDPRQAKIIELRYFGGLTNREIATLMDLSLRTIELDLKMARGFLRQHLDS